MKATIAETTKIASNPSRSKISRELTKAVFGDKLLPESAASARSSSVVIFAVWAVKNLVADAGDPAIFQASADYGLAHIDEIVEQESVARGYTKELTRRYLTEYISYDFGPVEQRSLDTFLRAAADLGIVEKMPELSYLEAPAVAGQTS